MSRGKLGLIVASTVASLAVVLYMYGNHSSAPPTPQSYSLESPEGQAIHQQIMQMQQAQTSANSNFKK